MTDMTMTMKLNHLSFPSTDVAATAAFFVQHLGCTGATHGPGSCILKRPGFDIVIDDARGKDLTWPRDFHIGFELPSVEAVRTLHDRFRNDGVEIETAFFKHARGSRFFCRAPGGVLVEINTRADAEEAWRGSFDN